MCELILTIPSFKYMHCVTVLTVLSFYNSNQKRDGHFTPEINATK